MGLERDVSKYVNRVRIAARDRGSLFRIKHLNSGKCYISKIEFDM